MTRANSNIQRFLVRSTWLLLAVLTAGLFSDLVLQPGFSLFRVYLPPAKDLPHFESVEIDFLKELIAQDMAVLVDARAASAFRDSHIPGAVSLPIKDFNRIFPEVRARLPLDMPIITYCSDRNCSDSLHLAERLYREGYRDIFIFKGGMEKWSAGQQRRSGDGL